MNNTAKLEALISGLTETELQDLYNMLLPIADPGTTQEERKAIFARMEAERERS